MARIYDVPCPENNSIAARLESNLCCSFGPPPYAHVSTCMYKYKVQTVLCIPDKTAFAHAVAALAVGPLYLQQLMSVL